MTNIDNFFEEVELLQYEFRNMLPTNHDCLLYAVSNQ